MQSVERDHLVHVVGWRGQARHTGQRGDKRMVAIHRLEGGPPRPVNKPIADGSGGKLDLPLQRSYRAALRCIQRLGLAEILLRYRTV